MFLTITLPYLRPALIGSGLVAFLASFENFNTTLFHVGSDAPLTDTLYDRMLKVGSPPAERGLPAADGGVGLLALVSVLVQLEKKEPSSSQQ